MRYKLNFVFFLKNKYVLMIRQCKGVSAVRKGFHCLIVFRLFDVSFVHYTVADLALRTF